MKKILILCLPVLAGFFIVGQPSAADPQDELRQQAARVFGVLPAAMVSDKNPITAEKVMLGKMLFFEPRISVDGAVSCSRCHPFSLYAADGLKKSVGNNCRPNPRNAPTIFNAADQISAHWIGNRKDIEDQAKQALVGPPSFGMPSYELVMERLNQLGYGPFFRKAFPSDKDPVNADNFAMAVSAYERTLVTPAPFDAYLKGEGKALTSQQVQGLRAFMDTGCSGCHNGPYFGGRMYQKFGIREPYWTVTKSDPIDEGRFAATKNEADKYYFKVPVLRNVAKTPPYFHDGSVARLEDAIVIMARLQLGKRIEGSQIQDIAAFLGALTGELSADMLAVPVLP